MGPGDFVDRPSHPFDHLLAVAHCWSVAVLHSLRGCHGSNLAVHRGAGHPHSDLQLVLAVVHQLHRQLEGQSQHMDQCHVHKLQRMDQRQAEATYCNPVVVEVHAAPLHLRVVHQALVGAHHSSLLVVEARHSSHLALGILVVGNLMVDSQAEAHPVAHHNSRRVVADHNILVVVHQDSFLVGGSRLVEDSLQDRVASASEAVQRQHSSYGSVERWPCE